LKGYTASSERMITNYVLGRTCNEKTIMNYGLQTKWYKIIVDHELRGMRLSRYY